MAYCIYFLPGDKFIALSARVPRDLFELNTVCSQTRCGEIWLYGWKAAKYPKAQVGLGEFVAGFREQDNCYVQGRTSFGADY